MRTIKTLLFALLTIVYVKTAYSQTKEEGMFFEENKTWKEITAKAVKEDKLIFLDCYTSWCAPCKAMAMNVFPLPEVGAFMNANFINVKFDMEKGEGMALHKQYQRYIPGYPTYLLINGKGEVVHQVTGYQEPQAFITEMKKGLGEVNWIALSKKYEAGNQSFELVYTYLIELGKAYQFKRQQKILDEVLPRITLKTLNESQSAYDIFKKYWKDAENPVFREFMKDFKISYLYKEPLEDRFVWTAKVHKNTVDSYIKGVLDSTTNYNEAKAITFIQDLFSAQTRNREDMLAMMLVNQSVYHNDINTFAKLMDGVETFGLLRYDSYTIGKWIKKLAEQTDKKNDVKQLIRFSETVTKSRTARPSDFYFHAWLLAKAGDKKGAETYNVKAQELEIEFKQRLEKINQESVK